MNDYSTNFPRLFAAVCRLDRVADLTSTFILVCAYKWLLYLLALVELRECVVEYSSFTRTGRIVMPIAFSVYILLFHVCMEAEFRTKFFAFLGCGRSFVYRCFSNNQSR